MSMTELEAARLVLAGLDILQDAIAGDEHTDLRNTLVSARQWFHSTVASLERVSPPWEPEPGPSGEIPWSQVACGDRVLAPNGTWYEVDAIARTGNEIKALLIVSDRSKVPTTRRAGDMVKVERGPVGQAIDLFAAGGINLEPIKSGVAA